MNLMPDERELARAHVFVSGRVQGVFFRQETANHARSTDIAGWVRNLPDGRVEAVFEGDKHAVDSMVAWCRKGPRHAAVQDLDVDWEPASGKTGFEIR